MDLEMPLHTPTEGARNYQLSMNALMECPCPISETPLKVSSYLSCPLQSLIPSLRLVQEFVDESGKVLVILIQKPMSRIGIEMQVCISID